MSDLKFTALATAVAGAMAEAAKIQPEILGAPIGALLAAHAGALFGLSKTPPEQWGSLLAIPGGVAPGARMAAVTRRAVGILFTLVANAFACAWVVAWLPHFFESAKDAPLAAGAGLLAFGGQHLIPRAFKALGRRVDRWGGPEQPDPPAPPADQETPP